VEMCETEMLRIANEIVWPHGMTAEFLGDWMSVGVQGDNRTYTRVIVISGGNYSAELIAELSTQISNRVPVNRVTYDIMSLV
jgi:GMP synthase PP-ATPase subunit